MKDVHGDLVKEVINIKAVQGILDQEVMSQQFIMKLECRLTGKLVLCLLNLRL